MNLNAKYLILSVFQASLQVAALQLCFKEGPAISGGGAGRVRYPAIFFLILY